MGSSRGVIDLLKDLATWHSPYITTEAKMWTGVFGFKTIFSRCRHPSYACVNAKLRWVLEILSQMDIFFLYCHVATVVSWGCVGACVCAFMLVCEPCTKSDKAIGGDYFTLQVVLYFTLFFIIYGRFWFYCNNTHMKCLSITLYKSHLLVIYYDPNCQGVLDPYTELAAMLVRGQKMELFNLWTHATEKLSRPLWSQMHWALQLPYFIVSLLFVVYSSLRFGEQPLV